MEYERTVVVLGVKIAPGDVASTVPTAKGTFCMCVCICVCSVFVGVL